MANDLQIGGQWVTIIEFPCSHKTKSAPFHPVAEDEGPAQNRINSTSGNSCSSLSLHFNNLIVVSAQRFNTKCHPACKAIHHLVASIAIPSTTMSILPHTRPMTDYSSSSIIAPRYAHSCTCQAQYMNFRNSQQHLILISRSNPARPAVEIDGAKERILILFPRRVLSDYKRALLTG